MGHLLPSGYGQAKEYNKDITLSGFFNLFDLDRCVPF